jgi:hypothetical protein
MQDSRWEVCASDLKPGDLVYSPRTEQLMLILTATEMLKHENGKLERRINLSWLPLTQHMTRMETNVNPGIIYLRP